VAGLPSNNDAIPYSTDPGIKHQPNSSDPQLLHQRHENYYSHPGHQQPIVANNRVERHFQISNTPNVPFSDGQHITDELEQKPVLQINNWRAGHEATGQLLSMSYQHMPINGTAPNKTGRTVSWSTLMMFINITVLPFSFFSTVNLHLAYDIIEVIHYLWHLQL
jgi:hypothetical protein